MAVTATAVIVGGLAFAWLIAAVAATLIGVRRAAAARLMADDARAVAELLAAAPAVPMLVREDGRVEAAPRLAAWLGLETPPRSLADLAAGGFDPAAIRQLEGHVASALQTGGGFRQTIALPGSERVLAYNGAPYAGSGIVGRAALLWFADVSQAEQARARLADETRRLGSTLDGLSALIESAPFPIWHRGADLRLELVNHAYVRSVEAADAGEVVRRGLELIDQNGDESPIASARAAREGRHVTTRTAPAIIAGERRMMRVIDVPVGADGVAGFATDVQELEDARADLGRFRQAQRDMLDRLSAGVLQFAADHGLVFYNRHFLRLFGFEPDWVADRPEFDGVLERMREAQRVPEARDFRSWRAERRAWFNATESVEEHWLVPGGMHLRVVAQPLPDGGLLLIFEDRTEHLQLASARDTLLRVRTATFDNLFEAVGVFAADGRLTLWNNRFRELWELSEADVVTHPRIDALAQSIAPRLLDPTRAGVVRELVRFATVERLQRSGRISLKDGRHYEFAAVPLPDGNALFTLLDITASRGIEQALRDRNEALEEANRIKNQFVASMSYELRVPLTSIAGFAEMLAGGYAGDLDQTARDYVDAILSAVQKLGALIGDVLDLSQSEAGSLPLALEPIDVGELVREAARLAAAPARAAGLMVTLDVAADAGMVEGDPHRLGQCLDHLLRNAIAYTPAGGRVLLAARRAGESTRIIVSDNGRGIPPRDRERIFERLGRSRIGAESSPDDDEGGSSARPTGLGLPLARQLVQAHGGTLTLDSEVGEGTSITVSLPLKIARDAA